MFVDKTSVVDEGKTETRGFWMTVRSELGMSECSLKIENVGQRLFDLLITYSCQCYCSVPRGDRCFLVP